VFGEFVDDRQKYVPTEEDNVLVWKLSSAMSEFYENEGERMRRFREILGEYGIMLTASELEDGSGCKTDGDVRWKGFCYLVVEGKNGLGAGGVADAMFEALLYNALSMKKGLTKFEGRFPGLIMYLCGASVYSQSG
jgi:hypothetical protein